MVANPENADMFVCATTIPWAVAPVRSQVRFQKEVVLGNRLVLGALQRKHKFRVEKLDR